MNILDQQIQTLIANAPKDGHTPAAVESIAPTLKHIAAQLKHPQYYILQTLEQHWVMVTLSNRTQPDMAKNVIYAYPTLKDASSGYYARDPQVIAVPLPVTHILFQMVALQTVNSLIFFETSGNISNGTEVTREDLFSLLQLQVGTSGIGNIPSDIA